MKCEVEFLAVGDSSRAGDCIVIRYGEPNNYQVMVVDGGVQETGEKLVSHIKKYFGVSTVIEHVVLTHSDADHASGLREVFKNIKVNNLWLHVPWILSTEALPYFNDRWTANSLSEAIRKEYPIIDEIVELAVSAGTTLICPLQGMQIGPFTVLSPSKDNYLRLLPQFEKTPEPNKALLELFNSWIGKGLDQQPMGLLQVLSEKLQSFIDETWHVERLKDGGITSASNESSVVLYADTGEEGKFLLTGDAGVRALSWARDYALQSGIPLKDFSFVQIPHHGSRRNVGPTILNDLIGPVQAEGTRKLVAFVSAPASDEKHPRKIVLNAFKRRGAKIIATQGSNKIHWGGFPSRSDYGVAEELPFHFQVENYD